MPEELVIDATPVKAKSKSRLGLVALLLIPVGLPGLGYAVYHYAGGAPALVARPIEAQLEFPKIPAPCCATQVEPGIQLPVELQLPPSPNSESPPGIQSNEGLMPTPGLPQSPALTNPVEPIPFKNTTTNTDQATGAKATNQFKGHATQSDQAANTSYAPPPAEGLPRGADPEMALPLIGALPVARGAGIARAADAVAIAAPVELERAPARFIDANAKPKSKVDTQAANPPATQPRQAHAMGARTPDKSNEVPPVKTLYLPSGTEQLAAGRGFSLTQVIVPYQGLWIGQFSGEATGNIRISVTTNGGISGLGSTSSNKLFPIVGTVTRDGLIVLTTDGVLPGTEFRGQLAQGIGTGTGTWSATGSTKLSTWEIDLQAIQR